MAESARGVVDEPVAPPEPPAEGLDWMVNFPDIGPVHPTATSCRVIEGLAWMTWHDFDAFRWHPTEPQFAVHNAEYEWWVGKDLQEHHSSSHERQSPTPAKVWTYAVFVGWRVYTAVPPGVRHNGPDGGQAEKLQQAYRVAGHLRRFGDVKFDIGEWE